MDTAAEGTADEVHSLPPAIQLRDDYELIASWLHGRPDSTQKAYRADARALLAHLSKPLRTATLADLQGFAGSLSRLKAASQNRKLAAAKSLCAFGLRHGYLSVDAASALQLPKVRDRLAERIVTEAQVQQLIELEPSARNAALLRLVYGSGLRISEACTLVWRDLRGTKDGGVATVFGKGGRTRPVLILPKLWRTLAAMRRGAAVDTPVFCSRKGGRLDPSAVHRIVKAAVKRAGLPDEISCHWLRHGHASHAADRGCPPHELQRSLGHASLATTTRYVHARPNTGSAKYLPE